MSRRHASDDPPAPDPAPAAPELQASIDSRPPGDSSWADQPSGPVLPEGPADVTAIDPPPGEDVGPCKRTTSPDHVQVLLELNTVVTPTVIPMANLMGPKVWYESAYYTYTDGDVDLSAQWIFRAPPSVRRNPTEPAPKEDHNRRAMANARRVGSGEG